MEVCSLLLGDLCLLTLLVYKVKKYIHVYMHVHIHVFIIYICTHMSKYIHIHIHILEIIGHTYTSNSITSPQDSFWFSLISYSYIPSSTMRTMGLINIHTLTHLQSAFLSTSHILLHTQKTVIFEKLVMYIL